MSFVENILHGKSIKRLRLMLDSLRTRDLSLQFNLDGMKGEERKLAEEMNAVINDFREDQMRQEKQYQYFDTLLNTVSAMLIVADSSGKVSWMNHSAVEGLCGFKIQHLNDLSVVDAELPALCSNCAQEYSNSYVSSHNLTALSRTMWSACLIYTPRD
ncbi:MAG: hypothetical protein KBT40_03980 [bacterium]|nr:hypothetical protein [Candidatus Minthenecus merdequi]